MKKLYRYRRCYPMYSDEDRQCLMSIQKDDWSLIFLTEEELKVKQATKGIEIEEIPGQDKTSPKEETSPKQATMLNYDIFVADDCIANNVSTDTDAVNSLRRHVHKECPKCHSTKAYDGGSLVLTSLPPIIQNNYICSECGYQWTESHREEDHDEW